MFYETYKNSFTLLLKYINDVYNSIHYIFDNIFVLLYQCISDMIIEAFKGLKIRHNEDIFQGYQSHPK